MSFKKVISLNVLAAALVACGGGDMLFHLLLPPIPQVVEIQVVVQAQSVPHIH